MKTRIFALAGAIGAGKSTLGQVIKEHIPTIDLDTISRDVMAPFGAGFNRIILRWPEVIHGRRIAREKLAEIVFNDPAQRAELEAIVHPLIQQELERRISALNSNEHPVVFIETPLLLKSLQAHKFDGVLVVHAPLEERIERIMNRDKCERGAALLRIDAQPSQEELLAHATFAYQNAKGTGNQKFRIETMLTYLEALIYTTPEGQEVPAAPVGSPWAVSRSR